MFSLFCFLSGDHALFTSDTGLNMSFQSDAALEVSWNSSNKGRRDLTFKFTFSLSEKNRSVHYICDVK